MHIKQEIDICRDRDDFRVFRVVRGHTIIAVTANSVVIVNTTSSGIGIPDNRRSLLVLVCIIRIKNTTSS